MKKSFCLLLSVAFSVLAGSVFSQVGGQMPLAPSSIPQFVDPLPHFAGLRVDATAGGNLTVKAVPHQQIAVSTGTVLSTGTVGTTPGAGLGNYWVYRISTDGVNFTPPLWPAFTVETSRGNPLNVTYINELSGQTYANVNLVLDQTLHWAKVHILGPSMNAYGGDVPIVPHLHGGEVPSESDGGPDAWFTPSYAETGPSWGMDGTDQFYYYPNSQEGATLWFHDHALGATRLNVYAGMAAFYFLRETDEDNLHLPGWSGDDLVQEVAPVGTSGIFNPDPYLPEIEIVIQDRMFDTEGELYFPNLPTNPAVHPFWTPEFIGDVMTVNGKTWPYLSVAPRKYRFRFLNGSNARFYELWLQDLLTNLNGPVIYQIGTDGGFLDAPVAIDPNLGGRLVLGPGERADVIIDFTGTAGQAWTLKNKGRTPYPKGGPPNGQTTGRIMQFVVNGTMVSAANPAQAGTDLSTLPAALRPAPGLVKLTNFAGTLNVTPDKTRELTLVEVMGGGGPVEVLVNNTKWDGNGMGVPGLGETELPVEGKTEVWKIINLTADAHPIHLHLVQFQLVSRQKFNTNQYGNAYNAAFPGGAFIGGYGPPKPYDFYYDPVTNTGWLGGNPDVTPYLQGSIAPAKLNEQGWKDTFIMFPGEVTTVVVRFAPTDLATNAPASQLLFPFDPSLGPGYVWHCHIIDHEDNEMMRPYRVQASPERGAAPLLPGAARAVADETTMNPEGFTLEQNYPNPFSGQTEIRFTIPFETHVKLTIYNEMGQSIQTLIDATAPPGLNTVKLDASNLSEGVYYFQLNVNTYSSVKKFIVIR